MDLCFHPYKLAIVQQLQHLKARVYEKKPRTLDELKDAIRVGVAQVDRAMLERVYANFQERLQHSIPATTCLI
ncbi:hypothetical protein C0J52_26945 [Blattella germanica]|nr:hypothetical protein C0J52_26945 [Blattella germanica]